MIIILSSCGLFSEEEDELKPTELMDFKPSLSIKKLWSAEVGQGSEFLLLSLMFFTTFNDLKDLGLF